MGDITIAYSGVHQIYQIAAAVHEMDRLDRLYCALIDAPRKWGRLVSRILGSSALANRRYPELPPEKITENPWFFFRERLATRFKPLDVDLWFQTIENFDAWVARHLSQSSSKLFVGGESCALRSFEAGKRRGMQLVLDCPGIHAAFRDERAKIAATEFGLKKPPGPDLARIALRKEREIELADWIFVYSSIHKRSFIEQGISPSKLIEIPLWGDPMLATNGRRRLESDGPLRVLYVGGINLRKGVPYLLDAVKICGGRPKLTMVGTISMELKPLLQRYSAYYKWLPSQPKSSLRDLYWQNDVLVMPSLGDSWGFVALEAMLCGLPIIITESCGAPVPDETWRVPTMNARAIAERLELYARDRVLCRAHGQVAAEFARQFTPERYRNNLKKFFSTVLG
jgi:glycosyltransferase involved in cell wall biosynthesis